jgi:hypothetical protein
MAWTWQRRGPQCPPGEYLGGHIGRFGLLLPIAQVLPSGKCAPACAEASQKANATLYCDITVEDSDSLPHSGAVLHDRSGIVYSFHCLNGASSLLKWRIRFQTLQHAGNLARWLSTTALLVLLSCYALDATPVQLFAYLAIFFAYPTLLIMRTAVEVWEAQQRHSITIDV